MKNIRFDKVVIDCIDAAALSAFYCRLLGWEKGYDRDGFIIIGSENSNVDIAFQENADYVPPVWPEREDAQQMMLHLDFSVPGDALQNWVAHAVSCGAKVADTQYSENWTVMLDPEGHPFCLDAVE